jgi:hypothetical protein
MNAEKLQNALRALTDLMDDILASDEAGRFARIQRLSVIAQKLQNEGPVSAKDFALQNANFGEDEYVGGGAGIVVRNPGRIYGNPLGDGDTIRNVMDALMPTMAAQGAAATARQRRDQAEELNGLVEARERLESEPVARAQLTQRINTLLEHVSGEEESNHAAEVQVVPAELLRGHLAGAEDGAADAGDDPGPVVDGEAGGAGPAETSPGVAVTLAVGVSLGLGADPPGDHDPADAAPGRTDLAGAAGAVPSAETGT